MLQKVTPTLIGSCSFDWILHLFVHRVGLRYSYSFLLNCFIFEPCFMNKFLPSFFLHAGYTLFPAGNESVSDEKINVIWCHCWKSPLVCPPTLKQTWRWKFLLTQMKAPFLGIISDWRGWNCQDLMPPLSTQTLLLLIEACARTCQHIKTKVYFLIWHHMPSSMYLVKHWAFATINCPLQAK